MQKRISCIFLLSAILVLCFALPVRAAEEFKKVSDNRKGAVTVSSTPIYEEASAKSQTLKTLKFGEKVVIKTQSENWYEVKKGSLKGFMKKKSVVMYNSTKKHVALTFDDGPNAKTTKKVLNALEKNKCRATFFLVGSNITKSTGNLLKREKKLGCEIGNHSYSHPLLTKMSTSAIKKQFTKTNQKIKKYTGENATVCRTPYGASKKRILNAAGSPHIFWSVDTLDWKYRNTKRLTSFVKKHAKDGDVILMHDIHKTTANAVDRICKDLKKKGFETVTVTELAAIKGKKMKTGYTYSRF